MYDESPVIKRLIEVGQKSASLGNNKTDAKRRCHGSEDIVLWCRFMDGNKAHPYICLGGLGYVSHVPGTHPIEFVWELLDFDRLALKQDKIVSGAFKSNCNNDDKHSLFQQIINI